MLVIHQKVYFTAGACATMCGSERKRERERGRKRDRDRERERERERARARESESERARERARDSERERERGGGGGGVARGRGWGKGRKGGDGKRGWGVRLWGWGRRTDRQMDGRGRTSRQIERQITRKRQRLRDRESAGDGVADKQWYRHTQRTQRERQKVRWGHIQLISRRYDIMSPSSHPHAR